MTDIKALSPENKYYLPKEELLTVVHFCRQYPLWVGELSVDPDTSRAIVYDKEKVQTSNQFDPTSELAMRRSEIARKKKLVEECAAEIAGTMSRWLVLGVCYGQPYYQLCEQGIPCGKDLYYMLRRKFYFTLAKRI